jgi:hypothetical protein
MPESFVEFWRTFVRTRFPELIKISGIMVVHDRHFASRSPTKHKNRFNSESSSAFTSYKPGSDVGRRSFWILWQASSNLPNESSGSSLKQCVIIYFPVLSGIVCAPHNATFYIFLHPIAYDVPQFVLTTYFQLHKFCTDHWIVVIFN